MADLAIDIPHGAVTVSLTREERRQASSGKQLLERAKAIAADQAALDGRKTEPSRYGVRIAAKKRHRGVLHVTFALKPE